MTSDDIDDPVKDFRIAAMKGNWWYVLRMYDSKRELRTEKIAPTGDTVLHMAVSSGELYVVQRMVRTLKVGQKRINEQGQELTAADENGDEKKRVLEAKNEKSNTPLHLAASASKGSLEMCEILGQEDFSLITIRNINGETPLFMAAAHGNKEAFLWLHYHRPDQGSSHRPDQGSSTYCRNHDNDTILHCAIAGGHIDLAIEIVHLYEEHLEEMTKMRNNNGLRPLHLLAATPSAFESTDLSGRSLLVQLLYRWFLGVKKEQATTIEELKPHEREPLLETPKHWSRLVRMKFYDCCEDKCLDHPVFTTICGAFKHLMWFLSLFLLAPIFFLQYSFLRADNWFRGIRKLKEKHTWSLQIMERLFEFDSGKEDVTANPYIVASEAARSDTIVDTPLMIAAQNGVTEMVEMFLKKFPFAVEVVNEEGKNIVLLAAEKGQTNLYRFLCERLDQSAFRQVDKDGNTALHLAVNLSWQTTTLVDQVKWFELVKCSVPSELREKQNNAGKTAEQILRDVFEKKMTKDRQWLSQTSQACSVVSTVVASMAFTNVTNNLDAKAHHSSLVSLSMSLTSTIILLTIVSVRSQSLKFWIYLPFMLHAAISLMLGSIASLWISLMIRHGKSLTTYAILGSPIAIFSIVSTHIFIGPALKSMFTKVPPPNRNTSGPIHYRRPQKKEDGTDYDRNQKAVQVHTSRANNSLQDIGSPRTRPRIKRRHIF